MKYEVQHTPNIRKVHLFKLFEMWVYKECSNIFKFEKI